MHSSPLIRRRRRLLPFPLLFLLPVVVLVRRVVGGGEGWPPHGHKILSPHFQEAMEAVIQNTGLSGAEALEVSKWYIHIAATTAGGGGGGGGGYANERMQLGTGSKN